MNEDRPPRRRGDNPGAMTRAMRAVQAGPSGPRVLRIGVIQDGMMVEERVIERRETVSIGTSERNHFVVQAPGLPPRFDLFELVGSEYVLNVTGDMGGRVALPGGVQELAHLRQTGGARHAGTHWQVKLSDASRGKVHVSDMTTLLFQFVVPPPARQRPQLPAATRGGFVKGIDWMFTAFVASTYIVFCAFMLYLQGADWPIGEGIAVVPERLARFVFDEIPEPPDDEVELLRDDSDSAPPNTDPDDQVARRPAKRPSSPTDARSPATRDDPATSSEARARITASAMQQVETLLIGTLGEGGALHDVLAGGPVTDDAADVFAQAEGGVRVATTNGGALRERTGGGGSGRTKGLGRLRLADHDVTTRRQQEGAEMGERRIPVYIGNEPIDEIGGRGVFDQGQVTSLIRGRRAGLRRCYETALRNDPGLSGKVTVQFTIEEPGTVSTARAAENTTGDARLASCVVRLVRHLRWSEGPEGGNVTFSYPFVFAPQR